MSPPLALPLPDGLDELDATSFKRYMAPSGWGCCGLLSGFFGAQSRDLVYGNRTAVVDRPAFW
jgi:hypothetical protein